MPTHLSNLLHYVTSSGWMLRRSVALNLLAVIERHERGDKLSADEIRRIESDRDERKRKVMADGLGCIGGHVDLESKPYMLVGRVAVVPVQGVVAKYSGMINGMSQPQGMTCDQVLKAVKLAHDEPLASSVCMVVDSPGGTVAGGDELVQGLRAVQAMTKKPMVAFAADCCCSGGYLIASQCNAGVYCSATAEVGSLGVYGVMMDSSAAAAEAGIKMILVASGPIKGQGVDGVPINQAAIEDQARSVMRQAEWYWTTVAEGRKTSFDTIKALGTGGIWTGAEAVQVGLCDGVTTLAALVDQMNRSMK